jgi:L-ascorbate metabolism protein UlaG (beta-lactamase superfamily)
MKVTFFGTTTLLFDDGKDQILFDAHVTRPSLVRYIFGSGETDRRMADEMINLHHIDHLKSIFVFKEGFIFLNHENIQTVNLFGCIFYKIPMTFCKWVAVHYD